MHVKIHTKFWSENVKVRNHFEGLGLYRIILEWILKVKGLA
jgi:hypothetical protein